MKTIKIVTVIGTRPEAIKMLPIIKRLEKDHRFKSKVVVTAQHREMLDQVLQQFLIVPDYDLDIMKISQKLNNLTIDIMDEINQIFSIEKPDIVLVHGDTTTTLATSLSAFYNRIKIGHVEAGLRTWDLDHPFPEEMNRQVTDILSDFYFTPTEKSKNNLIREGKTNNIFVTGNTAIDALDYTIKEDYSHPLLESISPNHKIILLTMHRRENHGQPMLNVFKAIRKVVKEQQDVEVIFPVHLNPNVQKVAKEILGEQERIHLINPLDVIDFHNIAARSYLILTDSGGVQEEAPSLGVPTLVLRTETERPEGVKSGGLRLIGTNTEDVYEQILTIMQNDVLYKKMAQAENPYGDGFASKRILDTIADQLFKGHE